MFALRRRPQLLAKCSRRFLNLQEYQSKKLMQDGRVTVQKFEVASSLDEAEAISKRFKVREFVIKAQILAGGRGKGTFSNGFAGGVHLTKEPTKVPHLVGKMLGQKLVTKQTGSDGVAVSRVMVAEALDIERETYLAILMDREFNGPVIVSSPEGGVDIEEVAASNPDAIFKDAIDIHEGLTLEKARQIARNLQFRDALVDDAAHEIRNLYELFLRVDATQVEINPFGETPDGRVVCFDAKFNFDDSAAFRQKEIFAMDDMSEADPREQLAKKLDVNYIALDGNIACLVNGAGLAMATMDIIKLCGGEPANFLDVGGTVTEKQVTNSFELIVSDKQVKTILVNIFGGIVNCATIANGIIAAVKKINLSMPLVVRLAGTNVEEARRLLDASQLPITFANDLGEAAELAVASLNAG